MRFFFSPLGLCKFHVWCIYAHSKWKNWFRKNTSRIQSKRKKHREKEAAEMQRRKKICTDQSEVKKRHIKNQQPAQNLKNQQRYITFMRICLCALADEWWSTRLITFGGNYRPLACLYQLASDKKKNYIVMHVSGGLFLFFVFNASTWNNTHMPCKFELNAKRHRKFDGQKICRHSDSFFNRNYLSLSWWLLS